MLFLHIPYKMLTVIKHFYFWTQYPIVKVWVTWDTRSMNSNQNQCWLSLLPNQTRGPTKKPEKYILVALEDMSWTAEILLRKFCILRKITRQSKPYRAQICCCLLYTVRTSRDHEELKLQLKARAQKHENYAQNHNSHCSLNTNRSLC